MTLQNKIRIVNYSYFIMIDDNTLSLMILAIRLDEYKTFEFHHQGLKI